MSNTAITAKQTAADTASEVVENAKVLVVDDVADNREVLTRRLVRRGFDVVEATGGLDALEKVAEQRFDTILLDIMMPDLNGTEVLKKLRQEYTADELPVIMVSAKSQSEDVVECLDIGANDYITKPVDFLVALARINAQVARKRSADEETQSIKSLQQHAELLDTEVAKSSAELRKTNADLALETKRRQRTEEELQHLAYHDSLTGLLNRTAFDDVLQSVWSNKDNSDLEPALLFIDLDHFKAVNDLHGHKIGDRLLTAVAGRLRDVLGKDTPIGRLGGDEFAAILLSDEQPEMAMKLGQQLVDALTQPFRVDDRTCEIGASCGVAKASMCADDLDSLIKVADLAMYHAKAAGRGGVVLFEPRMLEEQEQRRTLEIDLKMAARNGDFEVFYQPLINIETNEISCFEALIRWDHPTRGMISPEIFIPLAEETGLIMQIGGWVLREACKEAATWPSHLRIAVNLSTLQFRNPSLLPTIVGALASSGLEPSRLELEVTETALLSAEARNFEILESLRELGVRVSMDDFGTGYSSLGYLQHFRFDKIKIDKCFVQEVDGDTNAAIIQAIVDIGTGIGISTTAEGVETEEQLEFVRSQGCDEVQGYLFSRPLTAEDAREFIKNGPKDRSI